MRRKTTAALLAALCLILLLPGCGSSSRQVPDSVIERDTVDCDYDAGYSRSWTADTYSCVAATEDRARIMEFFMTHDDEAELLIQSPYIRAKLQIMCDAVRRYFDTAGWGTPCWERLL